MLLQRSPNSDGLRPDPVPKPSALRVAILRAAHQLLDIPLIFDDPLALQILGVGEEALLRSDPSRYDTLRLRGLRTSLVVRSRLAADEWTRSRQRGVRQYVILGAGLDTFAYRDLKDDGSRIFEVDLPATQEWKRHCLRIAAIPEPGWLTFVPIDFERSTLARELKQAAFDESAPAFFSWLGVTMYLEEAAVMSTLRFVASLSTGSGVVFDYAVLPTLLSAGERSSIELLSTRAAEQGEPWKTFFDPTTFASQLGSLGFQEVEDLGPEQLHEHYLSGRTDGLRKSGAARLIRAKN